MLARYGGDVVLRFRIHQKDEAIALAEAVNVLFLDVWEFNTEWVDIRLAKDVVSRIFTILGESIAKFNSRCLLYWDYCQRLFRNHTPLSCMILLKLFSNLTLPYTPMNRDSRLITLIVVLPHLFKRRQLKQTYFFNSISRCPSSSRGYG